MSQHEGIAAQWARLRRMRKNEDAQGLLSELNNPAEVIFYAGGETRHLTVRDRAAQELARLHDATALVPISEMLGDSRFMVRAGAAQSLGVLGDKRAIADLLRALDDENDTVRKCAARALGQFGDRSACAGLARLLRDENPWVRLTSAKALARIGDSQAIRPLKEAVRNESFRHPTFRLRLAKSLLLLRLRNV